MEIQYLKNSRVAIWGCGGNYEKKRDFVLSELNPIFFVDSEKKLWGKKIVKNLICYSPEQIKSLKPDVVVITPENPNVVKVIKSILNNECIKYYCLNDLWEKNEIELQKRVSFGEEQAKIKHFACSLGDSACNMGCEYCYLNYIDTGQNNIMDFCHSIDFMVSAVSRSRMGGRCFFNMCSNGETLLKPGIVEFVRGLLEEGHFVCLITNATVIPKIDELLQFPVDLKKRLLFHCSMHYLELKRKGLVDIYFENVNKIHDAGASVSMSVIGNDEYVPYRDEIKQLSIEKTGAVPYISPCRTEKDYLYEGDFQLDSKYDWNEYMKIWEGFSGHSLEMREKTIGHISIPCYSGVNSGVIDFESGLLKTCIPGEYVDNIYDDIKKPIEFLKLPHYCKWGFCSHNGLFLSGREIQGETLPTWNKMCTTSDSFISDEIREATEYCCDY